MKNVHNYFRVLGLLVILGGFALFVVAFVMFFNDKSKMIPLIFTSAGAIFLGIFIYNISTNNSRKCCNVCGKRMKGAKYTYKEIGKKVSKSSPEIRYEVSITATCPHCGKKKVFFKDLSVLNNETLKSKVDNYCKNKF